MRTRARTWTLVAVALLTGTGQAMAQDAGAGVLVADAGLPRPLDAGLAADAGASAAVPSDLLPEALRPALSLSADPQQGVMTGDLIRLAITAIARPGDDVAVPEQALAPFEVHGTQMRQDTTSDGRPRFVFTLELIAMEPGDHTLGPVTLRVITADGTIGTVQTDSVPVTVGALLGNEPNAELKPPTDPVQVMEEDYTLLWIAGALLTIVLLAVLMLLLFRWWSRRERRAPPAAPPRPPWDIALEQLDRLRHSLKPRMASGQVVGWADELSDVLRHYLGDRYDFDGLESTTDEVLGRLRTATVVGVGVEEVAAVLGDCDLVKFAKATPGEDDCEELLAGSFRIVRATAVLPSSAGAPVPPSLAAGPGSDGATPAEPAPPAPPPSTGGTP